MLARDAGREGRGLREDTDGVAPLEQEAHQPEPAWVRESLEALGGTVKVDAIRKEGTLDLAALRLTELQSPLAARVEGRLFPGTSACCVWDVVFLRVWKLASRVRTRRTRV